MILLSALSVAAIVHIVYIVDFVCRPNTGHNSTRLLWVGVRQTKETEPAARHQLNRAIKLSEPQRMNVSANDLTGKLVT